MSIADFGNEMPQALIVEDDDMLRRLLRKWIERSGFEVREATDGAQAQEILAEQPARLVVTDLEMPKIDGIQLIEWMRTQPSLQFTYVLMLTARATSADMVRVLDAGANEFITKPVQREEFLARLRAARRIMELEAILNEQARIDSLSGLLMQRSFFQSAKLEWSRSERFDHPLSCVMLDLDYFKRINDTYGHPAGDEVIRSVAAILKQSSRKIDIVARYGGEEFCILLAGTDEFNACAWAERVRTQINSSPIAIGAGMQLPISASFGVAQRMHDTQSIEALIDMADQSLLVAKRAGRDRVVAFRDVHGPRVDILGDGLVDRFAALTAGDVMTSIISPLRNEMSLGAAMNYLLDFRLNSLPVVDRSGRLCGYLSEKDCLGSMLDPAWRDRRVSEVMKTSVVQYEESTPARQIYDFLNRVSIRSVVVVRHGRPVGMLSRSAMLRWFSLALSTGSAQAGEANSPTDSKSQILPEIHSIARNLAADAAVLEQRLRLGADDPVACLVGGVSQLQERINDLLSASASLNQRGWNGDALLGMTPSEDNLASNFISQLQ
jgi:two-component system cell cycle response regulator